MSGKRFKAEEIHDNGALAYSRKGGDYEGFVKDVLYNAASRTPAHVSRGGKLVGIPKSILIEAGNEEELGKIRQAISAVRESMTKETAQIIGGLGTYTEDVGDKACRLMEMAPLIKLIDSVELTVKPKGRLQRSVKDREVTLYKHGRTFEEDLGG